MRALATIAVTVAVAALAGCPPSPPPIDDPVEVDGGFELVDGGFIAQPETCEANWPSACPNPQPRYAEVSGIFQARCSVCHNWSTGQWPLDSYEHVSDWTSEIRGALLSCSMPPDDAGFRLSAEESTRLLSWIGCGLPE